LPGQELRPDRDPPCVLPTEAMRLRHTGSLRNAAVASMPMKRRPS
jgi:hypothetical protein